MSKEDLELHEMEEENKKSPESPSRSSDTTEVYDKRYSNEEPGKLSPYLSRFDPEYLIVSGEERVFMAGFKDMADSNPMMQQLNSINKKRELWGKLKSGNTEGIPQEMVDAHEKGEPLVITAVDFGCGDGRSLELWQKMADELKDLGIVLRVKFYDVSEAGLTSLKSRLTSPILPKKYSDSLREIYGEKIYKKKSQEANFPSKQDIEDLKGFYGEKIYNRNLELGNLPVIDEEFYGEEKSELKRIEIYQNNSELKKEKQGLLKEAYGEEEYGRRKILLDNKVSLDEKKLNEEDITKLRKFYSPEKLAKREKQIKLLQNFNEYLHAKLSSKESLQEQSSKLLSEDSVLEMEDVESKMEEQLKQMKEAITYKLNKNRFPKDQQEEKVKEELDEHIEAQCKIYDGLIKTYEKIFLEEDCRNLAKIFATEDHYLLENNHDLKSNEELYDEGQKEILKYIYEEKRDRLHDISKTSLIEKFGNEYWYDRTENERFLTETDVRNLKNIYGKESYERRLRRDDFPTTEDYEELKEIYGDDKIRALKEKMPRFVEMDCETELVEQNNVTYLGTYRYRNFEAEILLGNELSTTPNDFKEAIGKVDISLVLYGSTSHIPDKELRKEFIKAVIESTSGFFVATLPGRQGRTKEVAEEIANGNDGSEIQIKAAEFQGDDKTMPYGIYTHQTLTALLNEIYNDIEKDDPSQRVDRSKIKVDIATKRNPADISKNWTDYLVDAILTPVANVALNIPCASDSIKDARYFGVVAPGVAPKTIVEVTTYNQIHEEEEKRR